MATKNLNTRIQLKYDEHANWVTNKAKVLLKGEIGFENVTLQDAYGHEVPHVLAKVGDGTKTWEKLPYLYANALDVYSWAKKTQDDFVNDLLTLADDEGITVEQKLIAAGFTKDSAVTALQNALNDLKGRVTTAEGKITALEESRATKTELAQEKAALQANIDKKVDQTAYNAKIEEIEGDITSINTAIDNLNNTYATDAELNTAIEGVQNQINALDDTYATDEELAGVKTELQGKINLKADQSALDTLSGTVASNTTAIGVNADNISTNAGVIAEVKTKVDAFFADDAKIEGTVDTLREIQNYIDTHGEAAGNMTAAIQKNTEDIAANASSILANKNAIDAEKERAEAAEKANADNIAENAGVIEDIIDGTTPVAKATNADTAANAQKLGNQDPSYYAKASDVTSLTNTVNNLDDKVEDIVDGTITVAKATDAAKLGGIDAANYAQKTDVTTSINTAIGELDSSVMVTTPAEGFNVLTGVNQTDGKLSGMQEIKLHNIAKTGNVNDLVQTDGDYIIFNCGSSTELI